MSDGLVTRIVVAEDNPSDVFLIEAALKEHAIDCELVVVNDGAEALLFFRELAADGSSRAPDLLLDLHLPKHDGTEIIREVRASARFSDMAVVVMSSSDSPGHRAEAENNSAHYFRKPSDLSAFMELGTVVKQALAREPREGHA